MQSDNYKTAFKNEKINIENTFFYVPEQWGILIVLLQEQG